MRKVVASMFLTLDGVMEAPNEWSFQFWTEQAAKIKFEELFASDALLLGRVTYQGFAQAWPSMKDEQGFGDRMNSLPKYVASTTLTPEKMEWNAVLMEGDIVQEVARLKQQPGKDILVEGSASLIQTLMEHDLIDIYQLMVYPIVVGKGKRLFREGVSTTALKLVNTTTFSSGVVLLTYEPAR